MNEEMPKNHIIVFNDYQIRRIFHKGEWWFSVIDLIKVLTDSVNPRDYWYRMKLRVKSEDGAELSTFCRQLKLVSSDGKSYKTDCANTESSLRIIQSIPSPKAEPFKLWLAKVGYERVQEIEDPELASTTEITRNNDAQRFEENRFAARSGGEVAGNARKDLERRSQKKVVTSQNYLEQTQKQIEKEE